LVVTLVGFQFYNNFGPYFPWVAGGILFLMACYYFWRQWHGGGICHHSPPGGQHKPSEHCGHEDEHEHSHWDHELQESTLMKTDKGDWAAVSGLFVMLTLSPCEGFLPVYLSGVRFGWSGFFVLSAILAVAALASMTLLTWLTLVGLERFRIKNFERYEAGLLGLLFMLLGALVIVLER
jgi:ABC-type nickel/cobalt efflux system permease component RcnA